MRKQDPIADVLGLQWSVVHTLEEIEKDWRALEQRAVVTPFQRFDWHRTVTLPGNGQGFFVVAKAGDEVRAIFPLMVTITLGVPTLRWHGDDWTDYQMPLMEPDLFRSLVPADVAAIWRRLRELTGKPAVTALARQPSLVSGCPNAFAQWFGVPEATGAYALNLGNDWDTLYRSLHRGSTRRGLKEKLQKLEAGAIVEFREITGRDCTQANLDQLFQWKSEQLNARGAHNPFAKRCEREAIVGRIMSGGDAWRVYALCRDGHPVALSLVMVGPVSMLIYQMAYENGPFAKFSPGRLLLNHVMEQAIADGLPLLDFSRGDLEIKKDICDVRLDLVRSIRPHSPSGLLVAASETLRIHVKRLLKKSPQLLQMLFDLNRRRRALASRLHLGSHAETSAQRL